MYKVVLSILGIDYKASGETLSEAITNLNLDWVQIKGKGVMKIKKGKSNYEHLFNMKVLRRIFSNKIVLAFWAKNLEMLLDSPKETNIPKSL